MAAVKSDLKMLIIFAIMMSMVEVHSSCKDNEFRCFNGNCVPYSYFCDNGDDCGDNSDEMYCKNVPADGCPIDSNDNLHWLTCRNMKGCYPLYSRCDGHKHCRDGSDEYGCVPKYSGVPEAKRELIKQILEIQHSRQSIYQHSTHLLKAAIVLQLAEPYVFLPGNETGKEIANRIIFHLATKELKNETFTTDELPLLISGLLSSCADPANVLGMNLVRELRTRVDNSDYVNPFSILTLCNAGDAMKQMDVYKVLKAFDAYRRNNSTDTQAVATMALECLSGHKVTIDRDALDNMTAELKRKRHRNGTIGDLMTTALVLQALIATNTHDPGFSLEMAVKFLLREINRTTTDDAFYVLPVLNSMSILNISPYFCTNSQRNEFAIIKNKESEKHILARLSIVVGNDANFARCWKVSVPANSSFYQLLETFGSLEPQYKVEYSVSNGKPYVRQVAKYTDDVLTGTFWFTYAQFFELSKPEERTQSPVDIQVKENIEFILWYKSETWNKDLPLSRIAEERKSTISLQ